MTSDSGSDFDSAANKTLDVVREGALSPHDSRSPTVLVADVDGMLLCTSTALLGRSETCCPNFVTDLTSATRKEVLGGGSKCVPGTC